MGSSRIPISSLLSDPADNVWTNQADHDMSDPDPEPDPVEYLQQLDRDDIGAMSPVVSRPHLSLSGFELESCLVD